MPANLSALKTLDSKAMDYYLTHAVYDIAGVAGHINPEGSLIMTNPLYESFNRGINAIKELCNGKSEIEVYNSFMKAKADALQMAFKTPEDKAILKLTILSKMDNLQDASTVKKAFDVLPEEQREILTDHLNRNGIEDKGVLVYYAPAFVQNLKGALKEQPEQALTKGFSILVDVYKKADAMTDKSKGVFTVLISDVARVAKENPSQLTAERIALKPIGENAEAIVK